MEEGNYLKNIKKGIKVGIITKAGKKALGIVDEIAVKKDFHPEGITVLLKSGEIGRVKKIFSFKPESEILNLVKKGESYQREFKSEALWSLNYKDQDIDKSKSPDLRTYRQKTSKVIIAKSIAALLNSEGGNLVIGVREKKNEKNEFELAGIHPDLEKLKALEKDSTNDGYKRMIIDDIIRSYFPQKIYNMLNEYLTMKFEEIEGRLLLNIKIKPSKTRIFLNLAGRKIFMIRTETETRQIVDEELVDYCMRRFLS
ncbi:MAG: DUF2196 domain-containing protein [Nanoarchaeota archaeon]|nr:DUF2196 domain-containing protein [Nanoarchaeota archaeon]MBU4086440.1 DUF2196 domain-containing protein [Nanoarchaeota archaeon]